MKTDELEIWKRLNECECVKKAFDVSQHLDRFCWQSPDGRIHTYFTVAEGCEKGSADVWLPHLYDPIRPERSLIGIYRAIHPDYGSKANHDFLAAVMYADRPDLALARAIIEQEGKDGAEIRI